MNFVRSIIVPQTIASETAQNTNWNMNLAAAGAVLPAIAGRFRCEPGLKVGKKPLPPNSGNSQEAVAPKASAKPTAQYANEATLKFVTTLATTVPTFFMREKPTSSIPNPACMNMTRTAATTTQTVSAPTPAAIVAVLSSAAQALIGASATRPASSETSAT